MTVGSANRVAPSNSGSRHSPTTSRRGPTRASSRTNSVSSWPPSSRSPRCYSLPRTRSCLSSQRRRRRERGRQRGCDLAGIYFDDVCPHGPQQAEELVLLGFPDLEVVQHRDEVFHEGIELAVRHPHVGMRLRHAEPGVGARPTGVLAQLVDELLGQSLQVGPGELLIDAVVLPGAIIESAGDRRDGIDSAEALIQGTLHSSTSCALVTNGPTAFPASHILKRYNRRQVYIYLPLTDRTADPGRRVG